MAIPPDLSSLTEADRAWIEAQFAKQREFILVALGAVVMLGNRLGGRPTKHSSAVDLLKHFTEHV